MRKAGYNYIPSTFKKFTARIIRNLAGVTSGSTRRAGFAFAHTAHLSHNNSPDCCVRQSRKFGFTLAEMMVVLLIMSIIMAAMAPVMTTKIASDKSGENSSPWKWVGNRRHIDAYLKGNFTNQRAAIGQRDIALNGTENARLILNTSDAVPNHIMFKNGNDVLGTIRFFKYVTAYNIAIGKDAMSQNTGYAPNLAIGNEALKNNANGYQHTAIGHGALANNVANTNNTAVGFMAINKASNGTYWNTAVGSQAMENATTLASVAVGYRALRNTTAPAEASVAIGSNALEDHISANASIAVGRGALKGLTDNQNKPISTSSANVAVGHGAMNKNESGRNNIAIGYGALENNATGSSNVAVGHQALVSNTTGHYNVATGPGALRSNTTGFYNVATGLEALKKNTTGNDNVAIGYKALESNTIGYNNTAIGNYALQKNDRVSTDTNSGIWNTAVGYDALQNNTTGDRNDAFGAQSLWKNTTGRENTAVGGAALRDNQTGSYNAALGFGALAMNKVGILNTALGHSALPRLASDNSERSRYNTAIGAYSLNSLTEGLGNVAIGVGACGNIKNGEYNICLGDNTGPTENSTEASDNIHRIYIGYPGGYKEVYLGGYLSIKYNGVANFTNVTDVQLDGVSLKNTSSDRRLKNVGKAYTSSLDKILQIKPFNYTFKSDKEKTPHVGVIAQDLQKVFPNAVKKDNKGYLTIRQEDMFYALINAVKELDASVKRLTEALGEVYGKLMKIEESLRSTQNDNVKLRQENKNLKDA